MSQNELLALRKKILDDVIPLAIDGVDNTPDRFELLLRIIQSGNADTAVYERAYDAAKSIENSDDKLAALMSLVDEIDVDLQAEGEGTGDAHADIPAEAAPSQPTQIPVDH